VTNPVLSPPLDLITTNLLTLLRTAGRPVYDGAYEGDPTAPDYWYGILYRIGGGDSDPTPDLDADPRTVTVAYQVTTVGKTRNQAEAGGRILRDRLLGRTAGTWAYPLTMPAGWVCAHRRPDPVMPGIDRVGDTPNAVYSMPARYQLTVTPAT
jgi:hypothetical protein